MTRRCRWLTRIQVVETLAPDRPDQAFAEAIRFRCPDRSPDCANAETLRRFIQLRGEDRITIMDDETIRMRIGKDLPELLERPLGGRVIDDIGMKNPARADLHRDEGVQHSERSYRNEEIAGHDGLRMVTNKGVPTLSGILGRSARIQILPHRPRRNP